jgi:hypothetical protein
MTTRRPTDPTGATAAGTTDRGVTETGATMVKAAVDRSGAEAVHKVTGIWPD